MALDVRYHNETGYLAVEVSGLWEQNDAEQAIEAIRDEADKREQTRLFLDLRNFTPPKSRMTRFFTGEHIAKHWGRPFRVAGLWTPEFYDGFAETVAVNRSATIKVFIEKEKALEWLLK